METEEDLDALLSEIRDLLADSPVPKLDPEQLKKAAAACAGSFHSGRGSGSPAGGACGRCCPGPYPAESPAQAEPAPEIPTVEEPTIPIGEIPSQEIGQDAGQAPAEQVPASVFDEQPTQVIPTQEIAEEMQAQEEAAPRRSCSRRFVRPGSRPPNDAAARKPEKKTKKKGGPNVALILLSLVIVAAAAFIVVRNVVPAFQGGILGGGEPKTAEGLTLDRTALDLAEAGNHHGAGSHLLSGGATAQLTWTSSKPEVATVDEKKGRSRRWPRNRGHHRLHGEWTEGGVYGQLHLVRRCPQPGARRDRARGQWSGRPRGDKAHPQRQRHYPGQRGDTQQITVTGASGRSPGPAATPRLPR